MDISSILTAIAAGSIQGITELLPISSSGHLLLFSEATALNLSLLSIAVLHLGTVGALLVVMWKSLPQALKFPTNVNILIGIIPAGIVGFFLADFVDELLGAPIIIVISLVVWGIVIIVADAFARNREAKTSKLKDISKNQALLIGLAQIIAFIPGTSRSGITTITGIFSGIARKPALTFSFLMGIPLLTISGLYAAGKLAMDVDPAFDVSTIVIALLASFFIGIIAAKIFLTFIEKNILTICGIYRIVLGIFLLAVIAI